MPSKENHLTDLTIGELRALWEKADGTPGERAGGFTKGQIFNEITRETGGDGKAIKHRSRRRPPFHPIDYSFGMRAINKAGIRRARSIQ